MSDLLRRRREMMGSKELPQPVYRFENVAYKRNGTDTGIWLFQEDTDCTILVEWDTEVVGSYEYHWRCVQNSNPTRYWMYDWTATTGNPFADWAFSGVRTYQYYYSKTDPDWVPTGVQRGYMVYDSVTKKHTIHRRGFAAVTKTSTFAPADNPLNIANGNPANTLLLFEFYNKKLSNNTLESWLDRPLTE